MVRGRNNSNYRLFPQLSSYSLINTIQRRYVSVAEKHKRNGLVLQDLAGQRLGSDVLKFGISIDDWI